MTMEDWNNRFLPHLTAGTPAPARAGRVKPVRQWAALAALSASLWTSPLFAVDHTPPLPALSCSSATIDLTHELRCVQCQNEALADPTSTSPRICALRSRHAACGKSDEEIRNYLVARYGEFILFRPRMKLAQRLALGRARPDAARRLRDRRSGSCENAPACRLRRRRARNTPAHDRFVIWRY